MKANKVYGLLSALAMTAVCASAFAQGGPPQNDDQNGPPPRDMQQVPGGPGGQMGRTMGPMEPPLIMRPDVCKELKLSEDQVKKIKELMPPPPGMGGPGMDRQDMRIPGGQSGGDDNDQPRMDGPGGQSRHGDRGMRMRGGFGPGQMDDKLADILSDSQMKRLKELRLQREGALALMRKDIAEKVGLSDDERQKIRGMVDEAMEPAHQSSDGDRPDRESMRTMHEKLSAKILKSLTDEQQDKWKELTGKPFKFDENRRPDRQSRSSDRGGFGGSGDQGPDRPGGLGGDDGPPPPPNGDGGLEASLVFDAMHGSQTDDCMSAL